MGIEAWGASSQGITASSFRTFLTRLRRAIAQSLRPNALGYFKPSGRITINYRFFLRLERSSTTDSIVVNHFPFLHPPTPTFGTVDPFVPSSAFLANSYPPGNATKRKNCLNYKRSDISESILPIRTLQLRQQPTRARSRERQIDRRERERK